VTAETARAVTEMLDEHYGVDHPWVPLRGTALSNPNCAVCHQPHGPPLKTHTVRISVVIEDDGEPWRFDDDRDPGDEDAR
jgi:hypothetical protein